jgi:hypothetical protein
MSGNLAPVASSWLVKMSGARSPVRMTACFGEHGTPSSVRMHGSSCMKCLCIMFFGSGVHVCKRTKKHTLTQYRKQYAQRKVMLQVTARVHTCKRATILGSRSSKSVVPFAHATVSRAPTAPAHPPLCSLLRAAAVAARSGADK